jgi:hypothetical protein
MAKGEKGPGDAVRPGVAAWAQPVCHVIVTVNL